MRGCWAPDDARLHEHAAAARRTWRDEASALAHLSNGIEGPHDRRHSDLISYVHPSLSGFGWVDVEAKVWIVWTSVVNVLRMVPTLLVS